MRFDYLCTSLFFFVLGCGNDKSDYAIFDPIPTTSITNPSSNSTFEYGEAIQFRGLVDDNSPYEDLNIQWISSIDGELQYTDVPDADGMINYSTASLSTGAHVITLRATDVMEQQAEAEINVYINLVVEEPSLQILNPDPLATEIPKALENTPYMFMAIVSDVQDIPTDLTLEISSDVTGTLCMATIDGSGLAQCSYPLPKGLYTIDFTVTDLDGNSISNSSTLQIVTPGEFDADLDGYTPDGGDCNDANPTIYPGAPELCDGLDNDCNDLTGVDVGSSCYDDDGDGFCESPPCLNASEVAPDCDDANADISPNNVEEVNGVDDNCDGQIDEGTTTFDDDGDGFCETPPCTNTTNTLADCDDTDFHTNPNAVEVCGDGKDNNCNGTTNEQNALSCTNYYYDGDGDTFGVPYPPANVGGAQVECWCEGGNNSYTGLDTTDCYDNNANVHPLQTQYFTYHRGDGSFDYNCTYGQEELQYQSISNGCQWGFVSGLQCQTNNAGWQGYLPQCGQTGTWIGDCDASYDVVCFTLCMAFSNDWLSCLLQSCSNSQCNPQYETKTQGCR